jgi:hypothetical protein
MQTTTNRPDVQFTMLTRENWAQDLATYLHVVQEALLHTLIYMREKMARLGKPFGYLQHTCQSPQMLNQSSISP